MSDRSHDVQPDRQTLAIGFDHLFFRKPAQPVKPHHESGHCFTLSSFLALSAESSFLSPKKMVPPVLEIGEFGAY